jgi:hypothetical protein
MTDPATRKSMTDPATRKSMTDPAVRSEMDEFNHVVGLRPRTEPRWNLHKPS